MRQQAVDVAIERGPQTGQHVGEPRIWLMAVGFGGGQQAHDRCGTRLPAVSEPAKSQFLRPSAMGRIAFSAGLLCSLCNRRFNLKALVPSALVAMVRYKSLPE